VGYLYNVRDILVLKKRARVGQAKPYICD